MGTCASTGQIGRFTKKIEEKTDFIFRSYRQNPRRKSCIGRKVAVSAGWLRYMAERAARFFFKKKLKESLKLPINTVGKPNQDLFATVEETLNHRDVVRIIMEDGALLRGKRPRPDLEVRSLQLNTV